MYALWKSVEVHTHVKSTFELLVALRLLEASLVLFSQQLVRLLLSIGQLAPRFTEGLAASSNVLGGHAVLFQNGSTVGVHKEHVGGQSTLDLGRKSTLLLLVADIVLFSLLLKRLLLSVRQFAPRPTEGLSDGHNVLGGQTVLLDDRVAGGLDKVHVGSQTALGLTLAAKLPELLLGQLLDGLLDLLLDNTLGLLDLLCDGPLDGALFSLRFFRGVFLSRAFLADNFFSGAALGDHFLSG